MPSTSLPLDLRYTPFSRRGSWLNLATPAATQYQPLGPGLYLRSNHVRPLAPRELFKLELLDTAHQPLPSVVDATPKSLFLRTTDGEGEVEIVFDGTDSLRIRGRGTRLGLYCTLGGATDPENATHFAAYTDGPHGVTINCRAALVRYQFNALRGEERLETEWEVDNARFANVFITPEADGSFELAIDEYVSTWVAPTRAYCALLRTRAEEDFVAFRDALPAVEAQWQSAQEAAAYILWSCLMRPYGQLARESMFMSLNWMDQIWSWDNCFNMAAVVPIDADLAFDQLMIFADHQDEFGAYPDGLNDGFKHYNFSKPPVQSILLRWIVETSPEFLDAQRAPQAYATIARFTAWWLEHRRYPEQVLVHGYHGNDIGWDNGSLMREGGPLISPDVNAFIVDQCRFLAEWAPKVGRAEEADRWHHEAEAIQTAIFAQLWNGEQFVALHIPSGRTITSHSHAACLPALLGRDAFTPEIHAALMRRIEPLLTAHGFATEAPDSEFYVSDGYWRGPIWAPTTHLMVIGLERMGERARAKEVALRFCQMCAQHGFGENFDALTGEALRDRGYTWTASVFLELLRRYG